MQSRVAVRIRMDTVAEDHCDRDAESSRANPKRGKAPAVLSTHHRAGARADE